MDDQAPLPPAGRSPRGHKAAAAALALVATLVAIGIFLASQPSQAAVAACMSRGGSGGSCPGGNGFGYTAAALVLLGGWGASGRAWRGEG